MTPSESVLMRCVLTGVVLVVLSGCAPRTAEAAPERDVLVLELGGGHGRLREALCAVAPRYGITVAPERPAAPSLPAAVEPAGKGSPGLPPASSSTPEASPPDSVTAPSVRTVVLGEKETVYDLARKHLGSGARWPEILRVNGWTEREARRLRPGTEVKLP